MNKFTTLLSGSDIQDNSASTCALDKVLFNLTTSWWIVMSQAATSTSRPLTARSFLVYAGASVEQWCSQEDSQLTVEVTSDKVVVTGSNYPSPRLKSQLVFYKATYLQTLVVRFLEMTQAQCEETLVLPLDLVEVCWQIADTSDLPDASEHFQTPAEFFLALTSTLQGLGWESTPPAAKEIFVGLQPSWQGGWDDLFQTAVNAAELN